MRQVSQAAEISGEHKESDYGLLAAHVETLKDFVFHMNQKGEKNPSNNLFDRTGARQRFSAGELFGWGH